MGQRFLSLAGLDGRFLHLTESLFGLQDRDSIAAVVLQPKVAASRNSFALWYHGCERIVTWGDPNSGGDSSTVQHQPKNVQQICGTPQAFAAILADGTAVTWGNPHFGGDSFEVQDQLKNVQQICGADCAFAAILADGTVVTWGNPNRCGDSSEVQDQLKNVQQICGADCAFAAILADGTVVTWGNPNRCGDSSEVQGELMYILNHLDAKWERVVPVELPRFIDPKVVVWLSGWVQIQDCKTCLLLGILPIPIPI